jgi:hypothetical protein
VVVVVVVVVAVVETEIGHLTHASSGSRLIAGCPLVPHTAQSTARCRKVKQARERAGTAAAARAHGGQTMIHFSFTDDELAEPVPSVGDLDILDGGAGCCAILPRQPIVPSDYAAVVPDVAREDGCLDTGRHVVAEVRVRTPAGAHG